MAPESGLKLPARQGLQLEGDASPENAPYVPAAQGNEAPPMQKAPGEHCWQEAAPEPEKVPAGQGAQAPRELAFAPLLEVPAGQGLQEEGEAAFQ